MSISTDNRVLVISYGNTLSGDDALGQLVAASLTERKRSNILAISVTQLVPELATLVASAQAVIFVDASVNFEQQAVEVRELTPACPLARRLHNTGPRELLALARSCYDHSPPAWLVAIPSTHFQASDRLSEPAREQLAFAKQEVERIIARVLDDKVVHA